VRYDAAAATVDVGGGGAASLEAHAFTALPAVLALSEQMRKDRRHLHAHPELSFQEHETAAYVAAQLRGYGIEEVVEGVGRTGVVALVRGGAGAGPCLALRADMDALPLQESGDCPFISQRAGVMHACGHDGHMAMLLAAARVLHEARAGMRGTVKLVFQPAEEGYGGAREMIKDGVLESDESGGAATGGRKTGPRVDAIYGAHLWSYDALGRVGARKGPMMAASDKFEIHVTGKGGHGAAPQSTVDAVVVAANVVTTLQTVVSRSKDPLDAGVLTCGTINGGFGYNIIADHVKITGTCRSFTKHTQDMQERRMHEICGGIGAAHGADVKMHYTHGYPPTVNSDHRSVDLLHAAAEKVVGKGNSGVPYLTCGAEDFSYFLQQRPGAFFFVGAALPGQPLRPHHKSVFDFSEDAMLVGASVFVQIVNDILVAPLPADFRLSDA
jgi:amidohydrolase